MNYSPTILPGDHQSQIVDSPKPPVQLPTHKVTNEQYIKGKSPARKPDPEDSTD